MIITNILESSPFAYVTLAYPVCKHTLKLVVYLCNTFVIDGATEILL